MFRRSIPTHGSGEEDTDVFAPVADLMVAVVFIFMLLALGLALRSDHVGTVPRAEHERVLAELAGARADAARMAGFVRYVRDDGVVALVDRLARADQTRTELLEQVRGRLRGLGVDVAVNAEAGTLSLPASSLFAFGRSEPSPEGGETIFKLGRVLGEVLPCYAVGADAAGCPRRDDGARLTAVYIEGHTDATAFGSSGGRFRSNWDLSAGRAIEAYSLLRGSSERVRNLRNPTGQALVGVSGYADTRPAVPEGTDRASAAAMEHDRRIEVRFLMGNDAQLAGDALHRLRERLGGVADLVR